MNGKLLLTIMALSTMLLPSAELSLSKEGHTDYRIVIADRAASPVKYAAEELGKLLKEMTKAEFPIVTDKEPKGPHELVIGETNRSLPLPENLQPKTHEGFAVLRDGDSLQFRGHIPRGSLYAVYDFLDEILGVRFLAFDDTYVPSRQNLTFAFESYRYDPPFDYRNIISCGDMSNLENVWQVRARLNSCWAYIPLGTKVGGLKHLGGFVHNLHKLMPHEKYFAEHPEYFAWRDGARRDKQYPHGHFASLPCLSNPEVERIVAARCREILTDYFRKAPKDDQVLFPIDYHDHNQVCQCAECLRINEEEGTEGGTMFRFLNTLAADVCPEWPNVVFTTLAYGPTLKPGKTPLDPRIIIRYAPIRADFARALDDPKSEINRTQLECLEGWRKAGSRFYVWWYAGNFNDGITPHADLEGICMNFPLLTRLGMKGMFVETVQSAGIEMKELRAYLFSRMLWRPERDPHAQINEFCDLYYGKGSSKVKEYLKLLHDWHYSRVDKNRDNPLTLRGAPPYRHDYTIEFIDQADQLLYAAEEAAKTVRQKLHVAVMHMPVWYLRANHAMNTERRVAVMPVTWRFQPDPEQKLTPETDASAWGNIRIDDFWTKQEPYQDYRGVAWYSTPFTVPPEMATQDLSLYFDSVDGTCLIYIDGKKAGEQMRPAGEMWNKGFYIHLPWKLSAGSHELRVRVEKDRASAGIWKPVALMNLAQDLSPATVNAARRYMATSLAFVPKRRKPKSRTQIFERLETLLTAPRLRVDGELRDGAVAKAAVSLKNVHHTWEITEDAGASGGRCLEQLPKRKWTFGQGMNWSVGELLITQPHRNFRMRVRLKALKKSDEGFGARLSFCTVSQNWSANPCAPSMAVPLKDLPHDQWVWIEYPHILKFRPSDRPQTFSVSADFNPDGLTALRLDEFELSPAE